MQFEEFDEFTRKLCSETEKIILAAYENPDLAIEEKSDETPVTVADRETERDIREAIQVLYPEHGIVGEEFDSENAKADYVWVIDPIDGTKTFASGCPLYGTMIALLKEGEPVFGCINFPALGKRIRGDGKSCYVNERVAQARSGLSLNQTTLLLTDFLSIEAYQNQTAFLNLAKQAKMTRTWGDCYGYYLLATGKADIMLDPIMNPWDIMALIPIVQGAGARITDWQGNSPTKGNSIVAANVDLHEQVLSILNP